MLLSWLRGERGERGARDAASYHRSRQCRRRIPEIKHVAQDAGDALNAVPRVYASQDVAEEFASTDDEVEGHMQEMVAGSHMDERLTGGDHAVSDGIDEVVELTAEEVYERFCRELYTLKPVRWTLRSLRMQPSNVC